MVLYYGMQREELACLVKIKKKRRPLEGVSSFFIDLDYFDEVEIYQNAGFF